MSIQITALVVGIVLFALIFEMLRRRALREKYAVVWLFTGLFIIVSGFFPNLVVSLSYSLGFNVPSNFVFSLAGLVMLIVIMHMSLEIGTLEDKVQTLAEESALMGKRIDDNEKHLDS
jgi:hypothetical protein